MTDSISIPATGVTTLTDSDDNRFMLELVRHTEIFEIIDRAAFEAHREAGMQIPDTDEEGEEVIAVVLAPPYALSALSLASQMTVVMTEASTQGGAPSFALTLFLDFLVSFSSSLKLDLKPEVIDAVSNVAYKNVAADLSVRLERVFLAAANARELLVRDGAAALDEAIRTLNLNEDGTPYTESSDAAQV